MASGILHCGQVDLSLPASEDFHAVSLREMQTAISALNLDHCEFSAGASQIDNMEPIDFTTSGFVRLTSSAAVDLTGMLGGFTSFKVIALANVGNYIITIKHQSTSSLAANRFTLVDNTDFALKPNSVAMMSYDPIGTTWLKLI